MTWSEFRNRVYPLSLKKKEQDRGIIWKIQRKLGVYAAYIFYKAGISANIVDLLRIFMSVCAFYLLAESVKGNVVLALGGVALLYLQVFLDFADGAVARAFGKNSYFGEELDGLSNAMSRFIIIVLFGIYTENILLIILSVSIAYLLVVFIPSIINEIQNDKLIKYVKKVYTKMVSVVIMLIVLPAIIIASLLLYLPLYIVSYYILGIYGGLASMYLFHCVYKK